MKPKIVRPCLVAAAVALFPVLVGAAVPSGSSPPDAGILGFAARGVQRERTLEKRFDALLSATEMRGWIKRLSSAPNQVGSPHDKANAEWLLAKFKAWGWDAHIEKFDVRDPMPKRVLVELISPTRFKAKLREPPIKGDRTSALSGVMPPYNVHGADGDVTAPLVYVNYGTASDYAELDRRGISVKGKIVIARYGRGWRGTKPLQAYKHGAIGCLIYSDPYESGYFDGDVYPKGAMRPPQGVQRGNVGHQEIPVLPISYADAMPLLKALGGPVPPKRWRGALPFTYHIGPGPAKVHMVVESDRTRKPIYDVIAKLPGSSDADQWVIRGNHHDAWVFGAFDPLAGSVALMGEAKALGMLYRQGWRPRRTIVYASWDAEEPGLLGSRAWAVKHARELKKRAVLYLNSDTNSRGFLHAGGSLLFQHMVNQVAASVTDPETSVSVEQRLRAHILMGSSGRTRSPRARAAAQGEDLPLRLLGSGSDYSIFLHQLGIASLSLGFAGEGQNYSVYHSRYDSFDHFVRFGDPDFEYEVALAKVAGHVVLRTANAEILPVRFKTFSQSLDHYVDDLHEHIKQLRRDVVRQHRLFAIHAYKLSEDPLHPVGPPEELPAVPKLDFPRLDEAVKRLASSAQAYERAYRMRAASGSDIASKSLHEVNRLIGTIGERLLQSGGAHEASLGNSVIMGSGGYQGKIFPTIYRALAARHWNTAKKNAATVATMLDAYRDQLDGITRRLLANHP